MSLVKYSQQIEKEVDPPKGSRMDKKAALGREKIPIVPAAISPQFQFRGAAFPSRVSKTMKKRKWD
jgi:hypothetical protein